MKQCRCCGKLKSVESFGKYYNGRNGRRTLCKSCIRIKRVDRQRKRRIAAFKHFGERCKDCGLRSSSDNYIVFDFHHLDESKKRFKLDSSTFVGDKSFFAELKKCVMLCSNCHRLRHFRERKKANPNRYQ